MLGYSSGIRTFQTDGLRSGNGKISITSVVVLIKYPFKILRLFLKEVQCEEISSVQWQSANEVK